MLGRDCGVPPPLLVILPTLSLEKNNELHFDLFFCPPPYAVHTNSTYSKKWTSLLGTYY